MEKIILISLRINPGMEELVSIRRLIRRPDVSIITLDQTSSTWIDGDAGKQNKSAQRWANVSRRWPNIEPTFWYINTVYALVHL